MSHENKIEERIERLKTALRDAGIKVTPQRVEIFRELVMSTEHPDADAIYSGVKRRMPMVSLDTVYRTLSLFSDLGLITTLGPKRESLRFDPNLEPHHHFMCTRCGLARDFTSDELAALAIPDAVKKMGHVLTTQVQVIGVCKACERAARA